MWTKIAGLILRNRIWIIVTTGIITLIMTYFTTQVKLSYEFPRMLPENDSTYQNYLYFKNIFGEEANIFAVGFKDTAFFKADKFNDWLRLSDDIKETEGVTNVLSIAQIFNLYKNTEEKKFESHRVFPKVIENQEQLDSLVVKARSLIFYRDLLYNDSAHVFLMTITLARDKLDSRDRIGLVKEIKEKIDRFADKYQLDMHYSGLPYIRTAMMTKVKNELVLFIFLSALVCAIILFSFFRSFRVVLFSLLIVSIGVVWSMGFLHILGFKITILTGIIPPLLIVIGIENSIFLLNKYHSEYRKHGNKIKSLQRVIQKTGNAIFFTNFTTACGFGTFLITKNHFLIEFGLVATLSIISIFLLAVALIPAFFSLIPPPDEKHIKHLENRYLERILNFISKATDHHRKWVFSVTAVIVVIGMLGITFIKTTGYMVDDISKTDPLYLDLKFFESNFKGVLPYEILIDTGKPNGVMNLRNLRKIDQLQDSLQRYGFFGRPLSIVEASKFARQSFYNGNPEQYRLPDEMNQAFLMAYIKKVNSEHNLSRAYVDTSKQITRITITVADLGTHKMNKVTSEIKSYLNQLFPEDKYHTIVTGTSVVFSKGTTYLIHNLAGSLLLAIIMISATMASLFSSVRMVVISLVPNIIPLILTAAIMGYFSIPIKPSTIIIFSIAFGISVDNTIHFLSRYRQELRHFEWNTFKAAHAAIREAGFSMIYTSVVLYFGFGLFILSSFGGTQALGILVSVTLLFAMFSNLILLPSLLVSIEKKETSEAFAESLVDISESEDEETDEMCKDNAS